MRENRSDFEVRELKAADIDRGLLETLANLSDMRGLTSKAARGIFRKVNDNPVYHVFVAAKDSGEVIGTTTLLVEQKFIHLGGLVGHIEDVAVRKGHEGRGVGGSLVRAAIKRAEELGCYKVILDCKADLVGFYTKLGFKRHEVGMRLDLDGSGKR